MTNNQNFVSRNNSYVGPMAADEVRTFEPDVLTSWAGLTFDVARDPPAAPYEIRFQFSSDKIHWEDVDVPLSYVGATGVPVPLTAVQPYFRLIYTNGATPLTELRLTTVLHRFAPPPLIRFAWQPVDTNEPVTRHQIIRSALPDGAATSAAIEATQPRDVTDRAGRLLGHVTVDGAPAVTGTVTANQGTPGGAAWPVSAAALPLPTGAATEATLGAAKTDLDTITARTPALGPAASAASSPVTIASDQTVPVSAASLPLPSGAATSARQDTGIASLASLDGKVLTDVQLRASAIPVSGPVTDAQLRASAVPISASALPLPSGAATAAKQDTLQARADLLGTELTLAAVHTAQIDAAAMLADVRRGVTDFEERFDYDVRTDGNPVYIGRNLQGTSTGAATWAIEKLEYDGSARPTRKQSKSGSWDGRAALF